MRKRLLIALSLMWLRLPAQAPPDDPRFTGDGQLMRPDNYREWIYLSSGLGMTYGPSDSASAPSSERFDNVFVTRSEEHTSELQSLRHLVCRLLLEKKDITTVVAGALGPVLHFDFSLR